MSDYRSSVGRGGGRSSGRARGSSAGGSGGRSAGGPGRGAGMRGAAPMRLVSLEHLLDGKVAKLTSPRSLEACKRQGIRPRELLPRRVEDFIGPDGDRDVASLKLEHFELRRREKLKAARDERLLIIEFLDGMESVGARGESTPRSGADGDIMGGSSAAAMTGVDASGSPLRRAGKSPSALSPSKLSLSPALLQKRSVEADVSTMIEQEKDRLEKMQRRQLAEIEQVLAYELRMAKVSEDARMREEKERLDKEEKLKQRRKAHEADMERKRRKEMERKLQEEEEDRRRREMLRQEYVREQRLMEEERERKREREQEARQREAERRAREEKRRQDAEEARIEQEKLYRAKMARMEAEEDARRLALAARKERRRKEAAEKSAKASKRIADALRSNERILAARRVEYKKKQATVKARQDKALADEAEAKAKAEREVAAKERQRKSKLEEAKKREADRVERLLARRKAHDEHMEEVRRKRDRELALRRTREQLRKEDKLDNIERMKRIEEFMREQTLQRIKEEDERTQRLMKQKADLIEQRRRNGILARARKHHILTTMEKVRVTRQWGQLKSVMPDLELDSPSLATTLKSLTKGKRRRKKKKKKRRESADGMNPSASLPDLRRGGSSGADRGLSRDRSAGFMP